MALTVKVRDRTTPTTVNGTATLPQGVKLSDALAGAGAGEVTGLVHLHGPALYDGEPIIAIEDAGSELFAFLIQPPRTRDRRDGGILETVQGRHVLALFEGCVVEPPAFVCSDLPIPADTLWFGWQHPEYDDTSWLSSASWGKVVEQPFPTYRPDGWPAPDAQLIWHDAAEIAAGAAASDGVGYFRKTFTLAADRDVVICATADDYYDLYLDGVQILSSRDLFHWKTFDKLPMRLCAGTHTLALRVENALRPYGDSPAWGLVAVTESSADGEPASTNQIYEAFTGATSGLFTLTVEGKTTAGLSFDVSASGMQSALQALSTVGSGNAQVSGSGSIPTDQVSEAYADATGGTFSFTVDGVVAPAIAWNATAAQVEAALEALPNVDGVMVTGAGTMGSPWVITFDGPTVRRTSLTLDSNDSGLTGGGSTIVISTATAADPGDPWVITFTGSLSSTAITMTGDGSGLTGGTLTVSETQPGAAAEIIAQTDTTWGTVGSDTSTAPPGMTPGEVVRLLVEQSQATGHIPNVDVTGFSDTLDSDGDAWTLSLVLPVPAGQSLWSVFEVMADKGLDFDMDSLLSLDVWEGRGSDLSATVQFDLAAGDLTWTAEENPQIINRALVRDATSWSEVEATGLAGGTERRSRYISIGVADGAATAAEQVQPFVDERAAARRDVTWSWPAIGSSQPTPYADFDLGDTVQGVGWDGTAADVRVIYIGLAEDDDTGTLMWVVTGVAS